MRSRALLVTILAALVAVPAPAAAQRPDAAMVGRWEGRTRLTAPWIVNRELTVSVSIRDDGAVTGTVGDARLLEGWLSSDRDVVASALALGREYVIEGHLEGPLLRAEGQQRARVRIALSWTGDTFEGELQTSGPHDGSPAEQRIMGTGLVLRRVASSR